MSTYELGKVLNNTKLLYEEYKKLYFSAKTNEDHDYLNGINGILWHKPDIDQVWRQDLEVHRTEPSDEFIKWFARSKYDEIDDAGMKKILISFYDDSGKLYGDVIEIMEYGWSPKLKIKDSLFGEYIWRKYNRAHSKNNG